MLLLIMMFSLLFVLNHILIVLLIFLGILKISQTALRVFNVFKYHVSCTDRKISVRIKIGFTFTFRLDRLTIQLVVFVPVSTTSSESLVQCHCQ